MVYAQPQIVFTRFRFRADESSKLRPDSENEPHPRTTRTSKEKANLTLSNFKRSDKVSGAGMSAEAATIGVVRVDAPPAT
jgi:hypothetical protein